MWADPEKARAWRQAFERSAYFRAYRRRYDKAFRAERRARGLCIECAAVSERFVRCRICRTRANTLKKRARVMVPACQASVPVPDAAA